MDGAGATVLTSYDLGSDVTSVIGGTNTNGTTLTTYDKMGDPLQTTDADGFTSNSYYNLAGLVTKTVDADSHTVSVAFDTAEDPTLWSRTAMAMGPHRDLTAPTA